MTRAKRVRLYWAAALLLAACQKPTESSKRSEQAAVSDAAPSKASSGLPAQASSAVPPKAVQPEIAASPPAAASAGQFTAGIVEYKPKPKDTALLVDVRSAEHEGFDRIVFEFAKGPLPGYHLEYVDKPVRKCGSGDATPIAGDGWLEVRFEPADAHTPSGAPTIKDREQKPGLAIVKEVELTCDFEAQVVWVIGVGSPNKYRVLTLDDPLRLVVDVKH